MYSFFLIEALTSSTLYPTGGKGLLSNKLGLVTSAGRGCVMLGDIMLSFTPHTLETQYNELRDSHECRDALLLTMQQADFLCWWCSGETVSTLVEL